MAVATLEKTMKFRIKAGTHNEPVFNEDGTHKIENGVKCRTRHKANDIKSCLIETSRDLIALFGAGKFERVHGSSTLPLSEAKPETLALEKMSVKALKEYAEEEGIDLYDFTKKADIIETIKEALAE